MSNRLIYTLGFLLICSLIGIGFYLQYAEGVIPCPLCLLQRVTFGLLGILFFIGMILPAKRCAYLILHFLGISTATLGMVLASRQLWLQSNPLTNAHGCGLSLEYMVRMLPIKDIMQRIFAGSTECSERTWDLFGIDMAGWALIWFTLFLIVTGCLFVKEWKK